MNKNNRLNFEKQQLFLANNFRLYGKIMFNALFIFVGISIFIGILLLISLLVFSDSSKKVTENLLTTSIFSLLFTIIFFSYATAVIIGRAWKQLLIFAPQRRVLGPRMRVLLFVIFNYIALYWVFYTWVKTYNRERLKAADNLAPISKKTFLFIIWFTLAIFLSIIPLAILSPSENYTAGSLFVGAYFLAFLTWLVAPLVGFNQIVIATDKLYLENYK